MIEYIAGRAPRGFLLAAFAGAALAACPGPDPTPVTCGEGTIEKNGLCIAQVGDDTRCGEGTALDPATNRCEPLIACGDGTVLDDATGACEPVAVCGDDTFYDLASRSCVPEAECGEGTVANSATRLCESPVACGPGTRLDAATRQCLPLPPCTPGTVLDEATGLCVGEVACGAGQVVVNGRCVEPNHAIALEADVTEGPGQNDPLLGGAPLEIALEPAGQRTVFVGGIDRPQDFDGDGVVDQDRDVWAFEAQAGDYLRVQVSSLGLAGPAYVIDGPRGYRRTSTIGFQADPAREILLPYDGRYEITVAPSAFFATGVPAGALDAGYVGTIERRALPVPTDVVPGASFASPAIVTGDLLGLDDNFFRIDAPARTAVVVTFRNVPSETLPAAIAVSSGLRLLSHVQQIGEGTWAGLFTPTGDEALFMVDWRESFGPADDFTIEVNEVPLVQSGVLPSDASAQTGLVDILTQETAAFQFVLPEPQLVNVDVIVSFDPDVQIVDTRGTRAIIDDDDLFFFYAEAGEYVVFINNDASGDDLGAGLALSLLTPHDLGSLTLDGGTTAVMTGPDLVDTRAGPSEAWGIVEVPAGSLLELDFEASAGDPILQLLSVDGAEVRGLARPHARGTLHVLNEAQRKLLVLVDSDGQNLVDWSVEATLTTVPPILEVEPNETAERATGLGLAPVVVRGRLGPKQVDLYAFELEAAPLPGQAIRIGFDDLGVTDEGSTVLDGSSIMVYDAQLQPLASIPFSTVSLTVPGSTDQVELKEGTLGPNTVTFVPGYEGRGPFFVEVAKLFDTSDAEYVLEIDVVDLPMEAEPNDEPALADVLGPLPASVAGYRSSTDPADLFELVIADPIPAGSALVVEWENLETNNALAVALETEAAVVVASQSRVLGSLVVPGLQAGTYYLRVTGAAGLEPVYRLRARVAAGFEAEPNDAVASAQDLGTLAAGAALVVEGEATSADDDVYAFSLAAPLAAGQGLRAEVLNLADTSNVLAEIWSGDPLNGGVVVGGESFDAATVVTAPAGTGPFYLRVAGAAATGDRYRARVAIGGRAEVEPNDDAASATVLSALPVSLEGNIRTGETDVYRLDLAAATSVDAAFANLTDTTRLRVSLRAFDFTTELGAADSNQGSIEDLPLPAGTYFLVVTPVSPNSNGDRYRLSAEVSQ